MSDVGELILVHLEEIRILSSEIKDGEKSYLFTEDFKEKLNRAVNNQLIKKAPDPLVSALIVTYLYFLKGNSHGYEIYQVVDVLYKMCKLLGYDGKS